MFREIGAPVETSLGKVAGEVLHAGNERIWRYRGIPFAAPPLGSRRWRHAEAAAPWTGVRGATRFGPDCPQPEVPDGIRLLAEPIGLESEDCLYLNIWTPIEPSSREGLRPVMLWIHGGGYIWGKSSNPLYDGTELARKGAVFVSINYRVGIFGFFTHRELTAESPHGSSGNYALGDQLAALRWVRDNIAQFGGDPDNVTIFGESAGSGFVHLLTACPEAKGLFRRAVGQSGAYFKNPTMTLEEAEAADAVPGATTESLSFLRDLPASELLLRAASTRFKSFHAAAIVDGHLIRRAVQDTYARSEHLKIPLLLGFNRDEGTVFPPVEEGANPEDISRERYWRPMVDWAEMAANEGQPVFVYLFSHVPPGGERKVQLCDGTWRSLGAFHTAEISFVFNNERTSLRYSPNLPADEPRPVDVELANLMSDFWVAFATRGVPTAAPPHDAWEPYDRNGERYYELNSEPRCRSAVRERLGLPKLRALS